MNQHPQRQPAPAPIPVASSATDARKLAEDLIDVMSTLLGVDRTRNRADPRRQGP